MFSYCINIKSGTRYVTIVSIQVIRLLSVVTNIIGVLLNIVPVNNVTTVSPIICLVNLPTLIEALLQETYYTEQGHILKSVCT